MNYWLTQHTLIGILSNIAIWDNLSRVKLDDVVDVTMFLTNYVNPIQVLDINSFVVLVL